VGEFLSASILWIFFFFFFFLDMISSSSSVLCSECLVKLEWDEPLQLILSTIKRIIPLRYPTTMDKAWKTIGESAIYHGGPVGVWG
jgi:hypothetical protein